MILGQLIEYYENIFMEKFGCTKDNFGLTDLQVISIGYSMWFTALYFIWTIWTEDPQKPPRNEAESQSLAKRVIRIHSWKFWNSSWSNSRLPNPRDPGSNHCVAPRLTQTFILPRWTKWIPANPVDLVVKSKMSPGSGSVAMRQV